LWGGLTLKGTLSLGFTGCDGERRGQDRGEEREERRPKSNRTGETSEALVANGLGRLLFSFPAGFEVVRC
jgi:hypothetical protein